MTKIKLIAKGEKVAKAFAKFIRSYSYKEALHYIWSLLRCGISCIVTVTHFWEIFHHLVPRTHQKLTATSWPKFCYPGPLLKVATLQKCKLGKYIFSLFVYEKGHMKCYPTVSKFLFRRVFLTAEGSLFPQYWMTICGSFGISAKATH